MDAHTLRPRAWNTILTENSSSNQLSVKSLNCQRDAHVKLITGKTEELDKDDLATLVPLNSQQVLYCLEERFKRNKIWSKAGMTLIAVNPFKETKQHYGKDVTRKYHHQLTNQTLPPHVFATAEKAYSSMMLGLDSINQSIIVSGESGAGKTWSARCLMNYLTSLAEYNPGGFSPSPVHCIERRIVDSSPILEAFGNAGTIRNENSSRFGKYIQIQFNRNGYIIGASIQTYLLEKTRVVHQNHAERNFHIFYQMCSGANLEERSSWRLCSSDASACHFSNLPQTRLHASDHLSAAFELTRQAMTGVGLDERYQEKIFKVLSGILHIGNLSFTQDEDDDTCDLSDEDKGLSLQSCCCLLGLKEDAVKQYLTLRKISATHSKRKSIFMKPCTRDESQSRRDCISKLLYSRLFDWLVSFLNKHTSASQSHSFIGILDIYGFESFHINSLEQLCINYANEKLQQHFVSLFLKTEQEEYKKEGLSWDFCKFTNNQPCLDAIEGPISVFGLINEECQMNRSSDPKSLLERILGTVPGKHVRASSNRSSSPNQTRPSETFTIKHYAGDIRYTVDGLVKKNKDYIPPDLIEMLASSKNLFIRTLVQTDHLAHQKSKQVRSKSQAKTVVSKFTSCLNSLMTALQSTTPHYIRCIKPNSQCSAGVFDKEFVASQLKACGVLETITISKAGFPYKIPFDEFHARYRMLLKSHINMNLRQRCLEIMDQELDDKENNHDMTNSSVKIGKTKVFLREEQLNKLEEVRNNLILSSVRLIQRCWHRYRQRIEAKQRCTAACKIQAGYRGWRARCEIQRMHEAAQIIQHAVLMFLVKREEEKVAMEMDLVEKSNENSLCSEDLDADQTADDSLLSPADDGKLKAPSRSLFLSAPHQQIALPQAILFGRHPPNINQGPQFETIRSLDDEIDGDEDISFCFSDVRDSEEITDMEDLNVTQEEVELESNYSTVRKIIQKPAVEVAIGAVMMGLLLTGPLRI